MMAISHDVFKEKNGISLITHPTLQSMLLVDVLNNYLSVPIYLLDAPKSSKYLLDDCALIIFDAMLLDAEPAQRACWLEAIFNQRVGRRIILINVNTHDEALAWHQHGSIIAAFPAKTHQQTLIRRLRALLVTAQEEPSGDTAPTPRLTLRELEVLKAMQQGASNLDISRILYISENTVRTHIYNIFKKIAVKNRIQAVKWADTHLCG
ncbi:Transcriptional regulator, LuxR family [Edwardsiella anguillarum]|uniref:LuxR C-terminal-related transcriptional regulator n=1 Tax=Edwardsiella TaxID=635 RepID=UPI00045CB32E|nr:LuxR C-terminal-related transcriptional regulator [Edwardsiella anguillarum]AKM47487.1 transcriptional regulator [Edwardsiella sp. EA181011]GAJ66182.1 transcriptional regulator CsgD [Edwardsiella piscicida]RFT02378.1 helix-turn-helix transcriptional regulator [Edwardsiella anguillarum]BET81239.1 Transcriptional regulator, LuxR family [Edwardsiella anguillarum]BET84666.1 Transcriptional regulator, LuxR family [Edwardsiella anguillarum]